MWGDMSKCRETSSYVQYMCIAVSLGNDKIKKLVKMKKQVKMIQLMIMRFRSVTGSREN